VNKNGQGKLNVNAFAIAMRLISLVQSGQAPTLQNLLNAKGSLLDNIYLLTVRLCSSTFLSVTCHNYFQCSCFGYGPSACSCWYDRHSNNSSSYTNAKQVVTVHSSTHCSSSSSGPGGQQLTWQVTPDLIAHYRTLFDKLPKTPKGSVPGGDASQFLARSGLPQKDLGHIW
jgi:hypothetical protein